MTVQIIVGDCREKLATLPTASVHLVVTDPPYGETDLIWDRQVRGWLGDIKRVMAPCASLWLFGSLRFFVDGAEEFVGWRLVQDVVWEKHNGSSLHADRFRRVHEIIAQFCPADRPWAEIYKQPLYTSDAVARTVRRKQKPAHWHGISEGRYRSEDGGPRLARSVFCARSEHGRAVHPTQKPVAAILPLIEYSCPVGGTVLDPFCGSGSTGIAAKQLGREFIGIEIDADYAEMARRRIAGDAPLLAAVGD